MEVLRRRRYPHDDVGSGTAPGRLAAPGLAAGRPRRVGRSADRDGAVAQHLDGADVGAVLEGIVWRYRVGPPWRNVPSEFGPWQTVWKRHHRWSIDGTYAKVFLAVQEAFGPSLEAMGSIGMLLSVDSTSVRAHQHAAGARGDVLTAEALRGRVRITRSAA